MYQSPEYIDPHEQRSTICYICYTLNINNIGIIFLHNHRDSSIYSQLIVFSYTNVSARNYIDLPANLPVFVVFYWLTPPAGSWAVRPNSRIYCGHDCQANQ